MPENVHFCRIRRASRFLPCRAELKAVRSLVSLSELKPGNRDFSDFSDLSQRKCYPRQLSNPASSWEHFVAHAERTAHSNTQLSISCKPTDELQSLDNPHIVISFHRGDILYCPNTSENFSSSVSETKFSERNYQRYRRHNTDFRATVDEYCSVISLSEKRVVPRGLYQGVCCRAMQSVELNQACPKIELPCNRCLEDSSLTSSFSVSSHSPSPVRSQVTSPFACGTIAPLFQNVDDKRPWPTKTIQTDGGSSVFSPVDFPIGDVQVVSEQTSNDYPNHLNPFGPDASGNEVTELNRCSALPEKPPQISETGVCASPFTISNEDCAFYTEGRNNRSRKKIAPSPPAHAFHLRNSDCFRNVQLTDINGSYLMDCVPQPTATPIVKRHSLIGRSFSVGPTFEKELSAKSQIPETKSMVVKRPAPSLPVYNKRMIKADSADPFVSYEKLHELLYATNKRIKRLEVEARKLQREIKQIGDERQSRLFDGCWASAAKKNLNVTGLLKKWVSVVELRDSLSMKHTHLLERLRRQELEEHHANLEHEFRLLWAKQNALKTPEERERENHLLQELLATVNQRAELAEDCVDEIDGNSESPDKLKNKKSHKFCLNILKNIRKLKINQSKLTFKTSF